MGEGVGRREEQVERRTVSKGQGEGPEEKEKWVVGTRGERMVGGDRGRGGDKHRGEGEKK